MFFETKRQFELCYFFVAEKYFALCIVNEWFNVLCSEIYCEKNVQFCRRSDSQQHSKT